VTCPSYCKLRKVYPGAWVSANLTKMQEGKAREKSPLYLSPEAVALCGVQPVMRPASPRAPCLRIVAFASFIAAACYALLFSTSLSSYSDAFQTIATVESTQQAPSTITPPTPYGELAPGVPDRCGFSVRRTHPPKTYSCLEYLVDFSSRIPSLSSKWAMHRMTRHFKTTPGLDRGDGVPPPTVVLADDEDLHDCYMAIMQGVPLSESSHPLW
jgi:hypothetical protein